jgi:hypothetical protein
MLSNDLLYETTQVPFPNSPMSEWLSLLDAGCWASVDRIARRVGEAG